MIYDMKSGNYVETIRKTEEFLQHWDMFKDGFHAMNENARMGENLDNYLRQMLCMMASWPNGAIAVLKNKKGLPLGFTAIFNATAVFGGAKTLYVYALYSNKKCPTTSRELLDWGRRCAKEFDYKVMSMECGNINGGVVTFFTRKLGFTAKKILFSQEIL